MIIRNAFTNRPEKRHKRGATSPVIERLEDRIVTTNPVSGMILVANADNGTSNYQGIVGVDPYSGGQYPIVSIKDHNPGGYRAYPTDVTEAPDGTLYVADLGDENQTDDGSGGIIEIPYSGGGYSRSTPTWIATAHQFDGLAYINSNIYAVDYGDGAGSLHNLYQVDPSSGTCTLISSGGVGNSGGTGFFVPTAIYPADNNDVYIVDEEQRDTHNLSNAHGIVWEVNLTTGNQSIVTSGTPSLDTSGGTHYGNPNDVAVNSSGVMVIMQDGPITSPPYTGCVVTWTSSQGQQLLTPAWSGGAANGMEIGSSPA
jgi:hypothetical protein